MITRAVARAYNLKRLRRSGWSPRDASQHGIVIARESAAKAGDMWRHTFGGLRAEALSYPKSCRAATLITSSIENMDSIGLQSNHAPDTSAVN